MLSLFPGCHSFEVEHYGDQSVAYIMKALEAGRRLRFERLHWDSVMPAHQLSQNFNMNRGKDTPPQTAEDYLIFKRLAYPEKQVEFSETMVATIQAIAKVSYPQWIRWCLPWGQILGTKTRSEPLNPLFICNKNLVVFGPKYIQDWIQIELAAFQIDASEAGSVVTLYDPITDEPVIDLKLPKDIGSGYYENERFKVLKFHKEDALLAHG